MKYLSIVRELLHIKSKKAGKNTVRFKSYRKIERKIQRIQQKNKMEVVD